MELELSPEDDVETDEVIALYKANGWSSAEKLSCPAYLSHLNPAQNYR
jgi:hypothetical protein